ncbi:MAG: dynamin family protein [Eubacteriales bacterium]|nr:dynamin family protein [Eubacteriales bacterium]
MENTVERKKDLASRIKEIAEQFLQFTETEFIDVSPYFADKVNETVMKLLDIEKPKVMVYGIYNSGKSTLINALCKEEVAEMADRPMTDKIAEYDRGDYFLVDSPGVDAPIAHEKVTKDYINKCHIILFVLSSKGMFEDKKNYEKLAELITKDIPFVIVLNDRGCPVDKKWNEEKKKRARFEHDQELKIIQYKIIQNLTKVSGDQRIVDRYEVVILNAKKALMGIQKNKPQLYETSGVEFLDKRISQMLNNSESISALFKQPLANLKECLNETEKIITQTMSGNTSEDFGMRLHTLELKKENIREKMKILTLHSVRSYLEELTKSYMREDADIFETTAIQIFNDIVDKYSIELIGLKAFVKDKFKNLKINIDSEPNLSFDFSGKYGRELPVEEWHSREDKMETDTLPPKRRSGLFDWFKSRRKREKERREQLEMEAEFRNAQERYKMQEFMRRKQEARQLASSDLDTLYREFNAVVNSGLDKKYNDIISQIQQIDRLNRQIIEDGKRQMQRIRECRKEILAIENCLS